MDFTRTVTHQASGASCTVHAFGATVISFKTDSGRECLFVSRDAILDGSKAIRGGIPLVFPQFGQPDESMPQHGFLRANLWTLEEDSIHDNDKEAGLSYSLDLKNAKNSRGGPWNTDTAFDCKCVYSIAISGSKMTTTLEIKNCGSAAFPFQTLQHTYLSVDENGALDPTQCYVKGLEGYSVSDKITNEEYPWEDKPVIISDIVDRVYNPPPGKDVVDVLVGVGSGKTLRLTASGTVDGTSTPVSCVVWNPYKEKAAAMGDFGDDQVSLLIIVNLT
jgi:glucose-6-phosphate 1-epimerase